MDSVLPYFSKELFVALGAAKEADDQDPRAVYREESPDTVELGGEDLKHHEGKGKLGECRSDIRPFEGPLGCAHFDDFI